MIRQVVSRSQRRMEKKQALIVLVLVLAVALASFSLGVMVGRGGAHPPAATTAVDAPPRISVTAEPAAAVEGGEAPDPSSPPQEDRGEGLTFYEALPRGEQPPMGSGINLPPENPSSELSAVPVRPAEPVSRPIPRPVRAPAPSPSPAGSGEEGGYLVQVASFRQAADAASLAERLALKRYPAYAEEVDLGAKGVWHRVFVGPYSSSEGATRVVQRLQSEDKLEGMVRKR